MGRAETRLNKPARDGANFVFTPVFKIDAPKQVARAVRERRQLPPHRRRRLGLRSTFRRLMVSRPRRVTFSSGIDNAEVMLRMLEVIFRSDAISCRLGVAGQRQIFFKQLVGIAANPHIRPITAGGSIF